MWHHEASAYNRVRYFNASQYIKHTAHSCYSRGKHCRFSIKRMLCQLTRRLQLTVGRTNAAAVLSVRGINIDMLQWPSMLIKYMLIEIQ